MFTRCSIYHMAKSNFHQGRYTLLSVPIRPWDDISMTFLVALLRMPKGTYVIMIVEYQFSKMAYFSAFHKSDDTTYMVFREPSPPIETPTFYLSFRDPHRD